MPSVFDREPGRRWPRSQRFALSSKGAQAEQRYREMIAASRAQSGRASFDAARTAWAEPLRLEPNDGLYLGELEPGPRTLAELTQSLEATGTTRREVKAALERLIDAGMIEPRGEPAAAPGSSYGA